MRDILDLERFPLDKPGSPAWLALVAECQAAMATEGMCNLEGLMRPGAITKAMAEVAPMMRTLFMGSPRCSRWFGRWFAPSRGARSRS